MSASPYRGLDTFTDSDEDAALFFGRDAEIDTVAHNLLAARLTVLYGPSGVGKSSLLRAGVVHRLTRAPADGPARTVVLLDDWADDSADELLRQAGAATPDGNGRPESPDQPVEALERLADGVGVEFLFVLDQFEEYLNTHPAGRLDEILPELLHARGVPVRMLIALREDSMAGLDRFKGSVPELFENYLRLDRLSVAAALRAIEGPLARYNETAPEPVELEEGVAEEVVRQLAGATAGLAREPAEQATTELRVEPAHLQLVMQRLWTAEREQGSSTLRLATLERLGGGRQIVQTHLRSAMDALPPGRQRLAFGVLNLLVTPSGMKVRHTAEDLAGYIGEPEPEVRGLLDQLAAPELRVLRVTTPPPDAPDATAFELYHDVLAGAVVDWRTSYQSRERRRLELRSRRLVAALIAVSAAAIGLVLYFWDPALLRRAELATIDDRMAIRGERAPDPDLVMVGIDAATVRELGGTLPLPRRLHAQVLDRIDQDRPRTIVYDIIFHGKRGRADDQPLIAAMQRARPRLALAFFNFRVHDDYRVVLLGRPGFVEAVGLRVGYSGLPEDPNRVLRRTDYEVTPGEDASFPTLALAGARVATDQPLDAASLPASSRRRWGSQSERTTWIDYRGGEGTVRQVPFADVLRGRVDPGFFRGKTVVVGTTAPAGKDRHSTPAGGGSTMSGPEIQASALDTILRGSPLRDVARIVDVLAIVALALIPVAALALRRPVLRVLVVVASLAAFLVIAQLAFDAGRIVAVVTPLIAAGAACLGVLIATLARRRARSTSAPAIRLGKAS